MVDGELVFPEPKRWALLCSLRISREFVVGASHSQFAKSFDGRRVTLGGMFAIPSGIAVEISGHDGEGRERNPIEQVQKKVNLLNVGFGGALGDAGPNGEQLDGRGPVNEEFGCPSWLQGLCLANDPRRFRQYTESFILVFAEPGGRPFWRLPELLDV